MTALMQTPSNWTLVNEDIDNLFEGFFRPFRRDLGASTSRTVPAMDVAERENDYVIRLDMPGVSRDDIDITLADGVLTVTGELRKEEEERTDHMIREERYYGKMSRSVRLGQQIDEKKVLANYKDGVLELILPKAEEVKPKKIAVS
ncbi:MAG: Hsp20/alpha crystallin family protein [Gammaproteobacteria bacterium]|nr:Hsp20/alpha crystallin family protein [Gammaproteobacteria bacterium]